MNPYLSFQKIGVNTDGIDFSVGENSQLSIMSDENSEDDWRFKNVEIEITPGS